CRNPGRAFAISSGRSGAWRPASGGFAKPAPVSSDQAQRKSRPETFSRRPSASVATSTGPCPARMVASMRSQHRPPVKQPRLEIGAEPAWSDLPAERASMDEPLILDRYRLLERLAVGGSAEVWRARDE